MQKRGRWILWAGIILVLILVVVAFGFYIMMKPGKVPESLKSLANPAENLSVDEAVKNFNNEFLYYLLAKIEAYTLHNPPLSSDKPRIGFVLSGEDYSAIVENGEIMAVKKKVDNPDIIIKTSKEEAVSMMKYEGYIQRSFSEGKSDIEMVAGKSTLFSKGYLNIYTKLTGKSITGNVFRIYAS